MSRCLRCLVSGRVQGVWFRAATRDEARRLGLTGSALNLADGRVEVIACGSEDALTQLGQWLWQGPQLAQVSDVQCSAIDLAAPERFTTG